MIINTAVATNVEKVGRVMRRPQHSFNLKVRPWAIQPCLLAPVLPGETMKNLLLQSRVVTDPIKNRLIGWWCEYYFFYVKLRDLEERDTLTEMMVDPSIILPNNGMQDVSKEKYYARTGVAWAAQCTEAVVNHYFREEGENWYEPTLGDTMPLAAAVMKENPFNSLYGTSQIPEGEALPATPATMEGLDAMQRAYEYLRSMGMANMSYEDYLRTYGVNIPAAQEEHAPELLRYVREWQYPSNTVDPVTGIPSSAVSWAVSERADKDRYFKEPGFIFGVQVIRPKVYMSNQRGSIANYMNSGILWHPAIMRDDPWTSFVEFADNGSGPLASENEGYWLDLRDLMLYGDQYVNYALNTAGQNLVALPSPSFERRFATAADADALFAGAKNEIHSDGIVSMSILGTQIDHTPRP
nr:MAG: major capsid protein [Microvirus sp.]